MIRLNLFMIWFLHFLSLLSVICRYYRQNSSSRIIVVLVYTVSTLFLLIVMQRGKTWQELTVFRQLKQCRRMKKQKHTRMPFFAFHFTSGDYSGEIYTTGPPGIFRPQTAITVYFCQVSKYVIGAYNV